MSTHIDNITPIFDQVISEMIEAKYADSTAELNNGFCSIIATEVYERLGEPDTVKLCKDSHSRHFWIECEGVFFDAERTSGVDDWKDLPYWSRNPINSAEYEYGLWIKHTGL